MSETAGQGDIPQPPVPTTQTQMPGSPGLGMAMNPADWQAAMASAFPGQTAPAPSPTYADFPGFTGSGATGSGFGAGPLLPGVSWSPQGGYVNAAGGNVEPWNAIDPGTPQGQAYWLGLEQGANPAPGTAPLDPGQYSQIYRDATANVSHFGGGVQIPFGVQGSQFNPTAGNPNFAIPEGGGYAEFTPQGQNNLANYTQEQLQQVYANAAKNRSGLSGFLGSPAGAAAILGFPLAVGGAAALAGGALGAGGAAGAGSTGGLGSSTLSSIGNFLTNPLQSLGLPSWTSWANSGLSGINLLRQVVAAQQQGQPQ